MSVLIRSTEGMGAGMRRKRRRSYDRPGVFTYALLIALFAGSAFPLWWSFVIGSRQASDINLVPVALIPGPNFLSNVAKAFETVDFAKALLNSVIISGTITLSVVFFSTLAGYAFAKLRFRGRNGLLVAVIVTMAIPTQLGIIPLFILMSKYLHWTGTLGAVIVPGLVTAFGVFFMRQYFERAIPDELLEAGRMDGCHSLRLFWHVALPAARPAAAVLGLFTFMQAWNDFFWPLVVLTPENPTVQTALSTLASGYTTDYTLVLTAATIGTVPVLAVFLLFGRQIVGGIMSGAVKG